VPPILKLDKKIAKDSWVNKVETVRGASEMQSTALSKVSRPCMKAVPQIAREMLVGTFWNTFPVITLNLMGVQVNIMVASLHNS
jgi:hypothetical protein